MKILKSKGFFIKSFLFYILFALITAIISWTLFERYTYNFAMKHFTASIKSGSEDIVIIAIDDKSISYHRWPWPREYYGKIIDYLNTYSKTKGIAFDALIQSSDKDNPESDKKFLDAVNRTKNLVVGFQAITKPAFDNERNKNYNKKFYNKFHINTVSSTNFYDPVVYPSISEYPDEYFNAVKNNGSVNVIPNSNGYLTHMNQIVFVDGKQYPSLGLRLYMLINNIDTLYLNHNSITDNSKLYIPTIASTTGLITQIRYYDFIDGSEYTHKKYSASDIVRSYDNIKQGKKPIIDPKVFDGKVVFVGANAKAAALGLEDAMPTPIAGNQPGVDIQATNFDNIMNNDFIRNISFGQKFLILIALSVLTFIIIYRFSFTLSLSLIILLYLIYFASAVICFRHNIAVDIITPLVIQAVTTIFGYSYRFILEGKNKEKIKQAMGKYLSQDIMKNVVQNIDDIKLGGKRATVTVLFADIRGFTSMSEKMTAEEVSNILNEYFTEIEPIITSYNGVINKFIGDAVMAIFGEPTQDINHPINAVKCAYAMLKKVDELRDKWLFEGKPKIEIGIGINTGEAFVGNIGSEKRLEYTVIGDTVNLASRIESYNKVYHTNFLISSSTYSYVSNIADVIKISDVTIRGKSRKMDIYEVLRINEL